MRDGLGREQSKARGKGTASLRKDWSYWARKFKGRWFGDMLHGIASLLRFAGVATALRVFLGDSGVLVVFRTDADRAVADDVSPMGAGEGPDD